MGDRNKLLAQLFAYTRKKEDKKKMPKVGFNDHRWLSVVEEFSRTIYFSELFTRKESSARDCQSCIKVNFKSDIRFHPGKPRAPLAAEHATVREKEKK